MHILKKQFLIIVTLVAATFIQGCGPLGTVAGDHSKTYNQDFDTMVNTVERAIRGRSLEINFANKSDDGNRYFVTFRSTDYYNTSAQPSDEGEVIIERVSANETKITINNPEYEPTIPSHHRKKYDKELMEEIDRVLRR